MELAYVFIYSLYFLAAFGFAYVLGHSTITQSVRDRVALRCQSHPSTPRLRPKVYLRPFGLLLELIECPACLGFWIGFMTGIMEKLPPVSNPPWRDALIVGFATAGSNLLLAKFAGLLGDSKK